MREAAPVSDTGTTDVAADRAGADEAAPIVAKRKHALVVRLLHWLNFPVLLIMAWSGMRIYWADVRDPYVLGIGSWHLLEFWPDSVESALQLDRRLAKGIAFHLVFGWLFVLGGVAWTVHLAVTGGWRRLVPDRRTLRDVPRSLAHDLHLRREAPPQGKYNPVQQVTYALVWVMAAVLVASGFAIYKPVQLSFLVALLGGYGTARFLHFTMTILLLSFLVVHVIQVARSGWANFASMITGYRRGRAGEPEVAPAAVVDRPERAVTATADAGSAR